MARQNTGDQQPANPPLSPFQAPPAGLTVPPTGSTFASPIPPTRPGKSAPTPMGILKALKRRWVMATFIGGLVAVAAAITGWVAMPTGKHQVRALVQIRTNGPDLTNRFGEDFESFRRSQMFILKTRDLINRTLAERSIIELNTIKNSEDPVRYLEEGVKVEVAAPDILAVTLTGDNMDDMKLILDTLIKKYVEEASSYERKNRDERDKKLQLLSEKFKSDIAGKVAKIRLMADANATLGADGTEAKLARMQAELARAEAEAFSTQREVTELEAQIDLLKRKIADKRYDVSPIELNRMVDMDIRILPLIRQKYEKEFLLDREKRAAADQNAPTIKNLQEQIAQLEKEIVEKRVIVKPEVEAELKVSAEQQMTNRVLDMQEKLNSYRVLLSVRQNYRDTFQKNLSAAATGGFDITQLLKELDPQKEYLNKIEAQIVQLRVEREMDDRVRIRETAVTLPHRNQNQKIMVALLCAAAGFILALLLVGYMEWRTRRIDGVDQVITEVGMRVIGTVPAFPTKANLKAAELAGNANWRFVLNESINATRTMLLHTARHQSMQVVMVTSAMQGEGKTSLTSQLATSMATAGMRTLIVDCDLRNPSIHKLFDLNLSAGVSEVLCQEADVSDAIQPTTVPNLWIIPAGQCSNRVIAALAQGHPLETLFNRLRGQFDFIIVDSCPLLPVADALLIGQHVDGVVFSIMQDISQLPKVLAASEKLAQLNIPLVGTVVNGIRQDTYSYGYNYVKQLPA